MIDRGIGHFTQRGLRIKGDTQARCRQHVNIVSTVADSDGLMHLQARIGRELRQELGLRSTVDNLTHNPTGQLAVNNLERVSPNVIKIQLLRKILKYLDETARNHSGLVAHPLQRPDRGARTRRQFNLRRDVINNGSIQTS